MDNTTISAVYREEKSSSQYRRDGMVPGVMYGNSIQNKNIAIDKKIANKLVQKLNQSVLFELAIENELNKVAVKEIQRDPVTNDIVHIDFQRINNDTEITSEVPIKITGIDKLKSSGYFMQQQKNRLTVKGLPSSIPTSVEIDVSNIDKGKSIHVYDVEVSDELSILDNTNQIIALAVDGSQMVDAEEKETDRYKEAVENKTSDNSNDENNIIKQ